MSAYPEIYKCLSCGNIVEILHGGGGDLACCGTAVQLVQAGAVDAAKEKHVPVIEKIDDGYKISVGSLSHPMEDKHFIRWIELLADNRSYRKLLNPGEAPEAFFCTDAVAVTARAYCNLHGLWKADI